MKRFALVILSPLVCVGLLAGMWAEARTRVRASDAEPYHARARAVIESLPYQLGGWVGRDEAIPPAAVKLLRPNAMVSRTYVNPRQIDRQAGLLIVQCKDSRDMLGHYPPVCYPAHGMTPVAEERRDWQVGDQAVAGTEYRFAHSDGTRKYEMVVYNFMIVPGVGIVRDMDGVAAAASDYQQRFFGATQFQMTLSADIPQPERDRAFVTLVGANSSLIETLKSGGIE